MHSQMMHRTVWPLAVTAVLLLGLWLVDSGLAQEETDSQQVAGIAATTGEAITYQGRLADDAGNPLNGSYTMRFFLYTASAGGSAVYDSGDLTVGVDDGLFTVDLDVAQNLLDGQALWLSINVEGETLSPRQAIRPAPYAMSLRPGAVVEMEEQGDGFTVRNTATGSAIRGEAATGLYAAGDNFGVYGQTSGTGNGYGGYFETDTGVGVYGESTAPRTTTNPLVPGVWGKSEHGAAIYGEAGGEFAWGGYFDGHVRVNGSQVVKEDLYVNRNLTVTGNLTVEGDKGGYVVDVALNDGPEPLERGDVVVVTGVADPVLGEIPVPRVRKANEAGSTGVIGVVSRRYSGDGEAGDGAGETIEAGDYLKVVTLGAFKAVKVDASYGAIAPGDLLVSSPTPGHAMRADDPGTGTVIGKALGELEGGSDLIAVMVSLQ